MNESKNRSEYICPRCEKPAYALRSVCDGGNREYFLCLSCLTLYCDEQDHAWFAGEYFYAGKYRIEVIR